MKTTILREMLENMVRNASTEQLEALACTTYANAMEEFSDFINDFQKDYK